MAWDEIIDVVSPHVVRIESQTGYGSGFLAFYNFDRSWCGIATAAHVVAHADDWQLPIKIRHDGSPSGPRFLSAENRVIMIDRINDSAIILFVKGDLDLPESPIALTPVGEPCKIGSDVGWLGYPMIEADTLCFFSGTLSARHNSNKSYLIDGVAINGVSGGPVFHRLTGGEIEIIGCVSAYHANRATGEALPGLLRAQDVSHFHQSAEAIRNIDEARERKLFYEQQQRDDPNSLLS